MKWSALLPLTVGAFLSASAFRLAFHTPASKTETVNQFSKQKKQAVGCSPSYVPSAGDNIPALTGWGNYKWKVSTLSDSAQFYFNQGMAMYYAFHIVEARASFDKAARFDPSCAMAWWGKALAFGPNINDFGYQPPSEAYPSAKNAVSLKTKSTPLEKALIDAIVVRYSADTSISQASLNEKYREAMSKVYQQFPANADVAALYADALMLLHPWDLYNHDYTPKAWTPLIVATIRKALQLSPKHPGANHYHIHAVEASAKPGDALKSADILATAMPAVSHITHMPSHIYIRTGHYQKGIDQNDKGVAGYRQYLAAFAPVEESAFLYSLHNLHLKVACAQMAGSYTEALAAAQQIKAETPDDYLLIPGAMGNFLQYLHQSLTLTYLRFGKWDEILKEPVVDTLSYTPVLQHFARGIALARLGRLDEALSEAALMNSKMQNPVLKEPLTPFSAVHEGAQVAKALLEGVIAAEQKNLALAVQRFEEAVTQEEKIIYTEPRDWLLPARHYLGDALLRAGRHEDAIAVLQKDLTINPANGWAITGLQLAFEKLNRSGDIATAKQRLKTAWLVKDVEIKRPVF